MGIIETLAAGFQTVAKRPWPILILIVLDLSLWLGPRLTARPVFEQTGAIFQQGIAARMTSADLARVDPEQVRQLEDQVRELSTRVADLNLFSLLAWQMPSLVQSLTQAGPVYPKELPTPVEISLPEANRFVVAAIGLLLIGLVWTSAYNGALAQYVRGRAFDRGFYFDRLALNWLRLIGFYALVLLAAVGVGIPAIAVGAMVNAFLPALGAVLGILFFALVLLLVILLIFTGEAIFVGDLNPTSAARSSIRVVRRNFWSTLGLVLLTYLIGVGTVLIWGYLRENPLLFAIALTGNAFVSSGLTTATMIFYRDRAKGGPVLRTANAKGDGAGLA